ncbi:MAG: IS256 family transposase [Coprobacillus sp.]
MSKKDIVKYIIEEYGVTSPTDITNALKDLLGETLQEMMDTEFNEHMGYEKHDQATAKDNYRNGSSSKKVKTSQGEIEIDVPRDRNASFEPVVIEKHQRDISDVDNKIINLYARGMSTRDISDSIRDIYGIEVSATMISKITDKIIPIAQEWQKRPLHTVYPIVFIDCVHFNVKNESMVIKKAAYVVLGVTEDGYKEILGIYVGENESAKFWLSVLTDLKNRGVKDILILCSDGLSGIKQAIESSFPNAVQQRCVVHLIRNSCKYLSYKDRKEFCRDLKRVYGATNDQSALESLEDCKKKWGDKYPYAFKPWEDNWNEVCSMFNYVPELRKIMYTTNAIESLNSAFRKFTKIRTVFPSDESLLKSLYLAQTKITEKWNIPYANWGVIYSSLQIIFEGRI